MAVDDFFSLPGRFFLDSCTVETIGEYGEFLFENGDLDPEDRLLTVTQGIENLRALRDILFVAQRGSFGFLVGHTSRQEALARRNPSYMKWFEDVFSYSETFQQVSGGQTGGSCQRSKKLDEDRFGYRSTKDRLLPKEAVALDCSGFLTMETRLPRNGPHLLKELGIHVVSPAA